ncbi:YgiT-type zinc finger protein [Hippea alviniae]|uniref:YgiT-type zinc finger protein n=1 Tax=Hippea alviniae TaxID=1279027 RepID=UPI0003B6CBAD|nr:YgiT-type zinc finger protein [Hippea alviniae]
MRCKFCGREMIKVVTPFRRPVKGEMLEVKDIEVYRCPGCGATFFPNETIKHVGRKTGERLLKVAKERGRIRDEKEHLRKMREKAMKDIEDAIRNGEIKKREDAPFKIFT